MSGKMCVNFVKKDIDFILQAQNFGNVNQTSQILCPQNPFPHPVLGLEYISWSNEKIIFVGIKIYGVVHI